MQVSRLLEVTVFVLLAAMLCAGSYLAWREGSAFLLTPGDARQRFDEIAGGTQASGVSSHSRRLALADCQTALTGAYGRLQPQEARLAVARNCRSVAVGVVATSPLDGSAYAVAARANAVLGDRRQAVAHLLRSAGSTPHELWIAHQRVLTTREWKLNDTFQVARAYQSDIATMGMTRPGRQWLASWYMVEPEQRELIVSVIDGLEERHKRAFLDAVRSAGTRP